MNRSTAGAGASVPAPVSSAGLSSTAQASPALAWPDRRPPDRGQHLLRAKRGIDPGQQPGQRLHRVAVKVGTLRAARTPVPVPGHYPPVVSAFCAGPRYVAAGRADQVALPADHVAEVPAAFAAPGRGDGPRVGGTQPEQQLASRPRHRRPARCGQKRVVKQHPGQPAALGAPARDASDDPADLPRVQRLLNVGDQPDDQPDRVGQDFSGDRTGHRPGPLMRARFGRSSPTPSSPPATLVFFACPAAAQARRARPLRSPGCPAAPSRSSG